MRGFNQKLPVQNHSEVRSDEQTVKVQQVRKNKNP